MFQGKKVDYEQINNKGNYIMCLCVLCIYRIRAFLQCLDSKTDRLQYKIMCLLLITVAFFKSNLFRYLKLESQCVPLLLFCITFGLMHQFVTHILLHFNN